MKPFSGFPAKQTGILVHMDALWGSPICGIATFEDVGIGQPYVASASIAVGSTGSKIHQFFLGLSYPCLVYHDCHSKP